MDIRLALPAVAEDAESCRVLAEPAHEIEPDAVGLPAAHDVAEAEDTASHVEHGAIGGDQRFAGELAGSVGRDGNKRAVVLPGFHFADLTVDAAARGVQDLPCAGLAHGLDDALRQLGAFAEVDVRLGDGAGDVGVRGQVNDRVMSRHCRFQPGQVVHITADDLETRIVAVLLVVPCLA